MEKIGRKLGKRKNARTLLSRTSQRHEIFFLVRNFAEEKTLLRQVRRWPLFNRNLTQLRDEEFSNFCLERCGARSGDDSRNDESRICRGSKLLNRTFSFEFFNAFKVDVERKRGKLKNFLEFWINIIFPRGVCYVKRSSYITNSTQFACGK